MKKLTIIAASLILGGCAAAYVSANRNCTNPSMRFQDTVSCVNDATKNGTDAYSVSYRLYANQLLEQYNAGQITETEAKVKLQNKFLELNKSHVDMVNALTGGGGTYCTKAGKNSMYCY